MDEKQILEVESSNHDRIYISMRENTFGMLTGKTTTEKESAVKIFEEFCFELATIMDTTTEVKASFRILSNTRNQLLTLQGDILESSNDTNPHLLLAKQYVTLALQLIESEQQLLEYRIRHPQAFVCVSQPTARFVWTAKAVCLVEIIYTLHEIHCINGGDVGIGKLTECMRDVGIDIKDSCGAYGDIKRRKANSRTYFLNQLRDKLDERMERDDEKEYERRR